MILRNFFTLNILLLPPTSAVTEVSKNNCVISDVAVTSQWKMEIDLKFTGDSVSWASVLQAQVRHPSPIYGTIGQRIPGSKIQCMTPKCYTFFQIFV